jgi:hypothetical protein
MGVVVLGLFSNTIQGIEGAILLSIAHGFVSPALFICVGGIIYDRTHTRIINYMKGLVSYMPVFTILFFVFTLANTGIPLTLNFLGEQLSLLGIFERNPITAILGATSIVTSACYSLFLYNRLSYGSYSIHLSIIKDINRREFFLLLSLLIPTIFLGIFPNVILDTLHISVTSLLYEISSSTPIDFITNSSLLMLITKSNFIQRNFINNKSSKFYYNHRNMRDSSDNTLENNNNSRKVPTFLYETKTSMMLLILSKFNKKVKEHKLFKIFILFILSFLIIFSLPYLMSYIIWIKFITILVSLLIISFYLFNLYFLIRYRNMKTDNIKISQDLPNFIQTELKIIKEISTFKSYDLFLDLYVKSLVHSFSLFVFILFVSYFFPSSTSIDYTTNSSLLIYLTKSNFLKTKNFLPYYNYFNRDMSTSSDSDRPSVSNQEGPTLTEEEISNLNSGLDQLKKISEEANEKEIIKDRNQIIEDLLSSNYTEQEKISSYAEAFPHLAKYNTNSVFDKVHEISKSDALIEITSERGMTDILENQFIPQDSVREADSVLTSNIKPFDENISGDDKTKILGEFGEMTINEVLNKGLEIITPLKNQIENIGLDPNGLGSIFTFLMMYTSICKGHAKILSKYDPYKNHFDKLSIRQQQKLQMAWARNIHRFNVIAAPLLVTSLYVIKQQVAPKKITVILETNKEDTNTNITKSINLLVFLKKLPDYIGKIILTIISIALIKYLLDINSINLMDPFYIKIFSILGITLISIFTLDYLLKFLIATLFKNHGNLNISNKFPKILYEYISDIKTLVEIENSYNRIFLFYFVVYLIILLLLTTILILI